MQWLHPPPMFGENFSPAEDDANLSPNNEGGLDSGHGTAMLSLVMGKSLGVAKDVKPRIVRIPRVRLDADTSPGRAVGGVIGGSEYWLHGLKMVVDHVRTNVAEATTNQNAKAVVLMAFCHNIQYFVGARGFEAGFQPTADDTNAFNAWSAAMHRNLQALDAMGVVLVTGSGNNAKVRPCHVVRSTPSVFSNTTWDTT